MKMKQISNLRSPFRNTWKCWTLLCLAAAFLTVDAARATSIAVNFLTGANVGGTNGNAVLTTDSAGAIAQVNWNNVAGAQGTNVALVDSSGGGTTVADV